MENNNIYYEKQNNDQNPHNSPVTQQKSNKKIWLLILIPIVIIIIGIIIFLFINSTTKTISDDELSKGISLQLKETKEAKFNFNNEEHTIKVNTVSSDSVNLIIQNFPIQIDIKIGEEKKFDLDNDGFFDIVVKLNDISEGIPKIFIKRIQESTCTENWNCGDWSSCSEQGSQTRTCTDSNSCGTTENKPTTTQNCVFSDQSIIGTWNAVSLEQNGNPVQGFERSTLIFNADNTYSDISKYTYSEELISSGIYNLDGNKLSINITESNYATLGTTSEAIISIENGILTISYTIPNGIIARYQK